MIAIDARPVHQNPFGLGRYVKNLVRGLVQVDPEGRYLLFCAGRMPFALPAGFREVRVTRRRVLAEQIVMPFHAWRTGAALTHYTANHAAVAPGTPTVLTLHDALFLRHWREISDKPYLVQRAGALYRRWTIPGAAQAAAAIITVSEHSRTELCKVLEVRPEKIFVIPEAVDPAFTRPPRAAAESALARHEVVRPFVLALGSFDRRKKIGRLLQAYAGLARRPGFDAQLVLAGSHKIWSTKYPEMIEAYRIGDRVRLLPVVSDADLAALYASCAVFVYPSVEEGFGLPVLEAMACGAPVVAARSAAVPEVAGDAALYVDPEHVEELARAIYHLTVNAGAAASRRAKGAIQAAKFSWERCAAQTLSVYRQVG